MGGHTQLMQMGSNHPLQRGRKDHIVFGRPACLPHQTQQRVQLTRLCQKIVSAQLGRTLDHLVCAKGGQNDDLRRIIQLSALSEQRKTVQFRQHQIGNKKLWLITLNRHERIMSAAGASDDLKFAGFFDRLL